MIASTEKTAGVGFRSQHGFQALDGSFYCLTIWSARMPTASPKKSDAFHFRMTR